MRPVKPLVALATLTALAVVSAASADPARDESASFPVELGSFSTTLLGSLPARTHNIRLA